MSKVLALFQSTRAVIKAERLCKEKSILCKVIPVPRTISSECGMSLEIDSIQCDALRSLLDEEGIQVRFHDRATGKDL